jgi:hypothetical protein
VMLAFIAHLHQTIVPPISVMLAFIAHLHQTIVPPTLPLSVHDLL